MARTHRVRGHYRKGKWVRTHQRKNPAGRARGRVGRRQAKDGAVVVLLAGVVAVWAAVKALEWMAAHWWIIALLIVVPSVLWAVVRFAGPGRIGALLEPELEPLDMQDVDAATPRGFESIVRELLQRDGFAARVVGGGNDMAVDVVGTDPARSLVLAVQCKHTTIGRRVGVPVLYQIFGTAAACYNATHQIVVTNGAFTEPARRWGHDPRHRVHLIDRERLGRWLAGAPIREITPL